jgi:hypothetical protein
MCPTASGLLSHGTKDHERAVVRRVSGCSLDSLQQFCPHDILAALRALYSCVQPHDHVI